MKNTIKQMAAIAMIAFAGWWFWPTISQLRPVAIQAAPQTAVTQPAIQQPAAPMAQQIVEYANAPNVNVETTNANTVCFGGGQWSPDEKTAVLAGINAWGTMFTEGQGQCAKYVAWADVPSGGLGMAETPGNKIYLDKENIQLCTEGFLPIVQSTTMHEHGHNLGYDHNAGGIMDPYSAPGCGVSGGFPTFPPPVQQQAQIQVQPQTFEEQYPITTAAMTRVAENANPSMAVFTLTDGRQVDDFNAQFLADCAYNQGTGREAHFDCPEDAALLLGAGR
jgi:hypothetical protein